MINLNRLLVMPCFTLSLIACAEYEHIEKILGAKCRIIAAALRAIIGVKFGVL